MRLREHASIVVQLDGVRERDIAAVHSYGSRDARPEVGFDRAPQRVVHPAKTRARVGFLGIRRPPIERAPPPADRRPEARRPRIGCLAAGSGTHGGPSPSCRSARPMIG